MGNFLTQLIVIGIAICISPLSIAGSLKGLKSKRSFTILCLPAAIILAVFASQAFSDNLPIGIVLFDCVLVILNLFGVLLSVFYVNKAELYAGLPQDLSSLPSFSPEVSFLEHKIQVFYSSSQFQDVPTCLENVNHKEGEIVSQSHEAEEEDGEQEAFIMSKPDGEVRFQMSKQN